MPPDSSFTACKAIVTRIQALYDVLHSWIKVANELDVSPAMAWRVAKQGYEPKDPEIRKKLGFPEIIQLKVHRDEKGKFTEG